MSVRRSSVLAARLLGAHVGGGTEHHAVVGARRERRRGGRLAGSALDFHRLGEPEVEHLDPALRRHLDVGRLEVAVDDALRVRGFERLGDLPEDGDDVLGGHRSALEALGEVLTGHQLHLDEGAIAAVLEAVQRGDVGVIERGQDPRLALEPAAPIRRIGHRLGQDLDRDFTPQPQVLRPIHLAHAAGADRGENLVGADAWFRASTASGRPAIIRATTGPAAW